MTNANATAVAADPYAGRRALIVVATVLATLLYTIDVTIANIALPAIQSGLQISRDQVVWILTSYIVASAICTPLSGYLAVRYGLRRTLMVSVAGFTITSVLCGFSSSIETLVVYRTMQGVFGAGLPPLSQAALIQAFPRERQGLANALWGMGVLVGPVIGPTLGGFITEYMGWRWIFFVNIPVGAFAFMLLGAALDRGGADRAKHFAVGGFVLLALGLGLLQLGLDRGHGAGWFDSWEIVVELGCGAVFIYMFAVHNILSDRPFVPRAMFRDRNLWVGVVTIFMLGVMLIAPMTLLPSIMQGPLGYPVLTSSYALAPRGLGTMTMMLTYGLLAHRIDGRKVAAVGTVWLGLSFLPLTNLTTDISFSTLAICSFMQGLGLGMLFAPITTLAFGQLEGALRTEASTLLSLARNLGSSVGASLMVLALSHAEAQARGALTGTLSIFPHESFVDAAARLGASAIALLELTVQRDTALIGASNVFAMMMWACIACLPAMLLFRRQR